MKIKMLNSVLSVVLALASPLWAQGFAGLGTTAGDFAPPRAERALVFPDDHLSHPGFRIEWWYLTANLRGADGTDYGVQWTLFRSALAPGGQAGPGWDTPQLWLAHAALTTPTRHFSAEKLARGGVGQAGVAGPPFRAWIDDWDLRGPLSPDLNRLQLRAGGADFAYDLALSATGPLVLHGADGFSVKSADGQASRYYSQPFYRVSGDIRVDGAALPVTGTAWFDREWSSQPLRQDQKGWDWVALSLESGARLMGFRLRGDDGADFVAGTWVAPDGGARALGADDIRLTPGRQAVVAGRRLPVEWRVELPGEGVDVSIRALNDAAWMDTRFAYWEGPVRVTGSHTGRGYLEMTGYDAPTPPADQ